MLEVFPDEVIKREALGQTYTALEDVEGLTAPSIGEHNTSICSIHNSQ